MAVALPEEELTQGKASAELQAVRLMLGLYRDNGNANGNYYLGFRVCNTPSVDRI